MPNAQSIDKDRIYNAEAQQTTPIDPDLFKDTRPGRNLRIQPGTQATLAELPRLPFGKRKKKKKEKIAAPPDETQPSLW